MKTAEEQELLDESELSDGRKLRGEKSRQKIVDALLQLIREGNVSPSAEAVADRAGVGLRTVFRHFNDLDLLYREMSQEIERRHLSALRQPYTGDLWHEQLIEHAKRQWRACEEVMPFQIASAVHLTRSAFLRRENERILVIQRKKLEQLLPESLHGELLLVEGLSLILSFGAWRRLRLDQKLDAAESVSVLLGLAQELLQPYLQLASGDDLDQK